jgi:hypothetical protein
MDASSEAPSCASSQQHAGTQRRRKCRFRATAHGLYELAGVKRHPELTPCCLTQECFRRPAARYIQPGAQKRCGALD